MIPSIPYQKPLLLGICIILFFTHLADVSPPTIMEARNFISAREMLESGNWAIPTLNGNTRIRKPPLPTWITAASIALNGDPNSLMALRFPSAMIATIMIFFLYGLVKDLFLNSNAAFYSAAILASCYMLIEEAKTGAWDIYCNAFMLGAIWMLYRASKHNLLKYWILSGVLMGFSFLSKGPVSFYALLLPFLIAFFVSKNKFSQPTLTGAGLSILIMLLVSAAWPLYLYIKIPDIATQIAHEESSAWINRHNRPFWFYLHFPLFTGIWALTTVFAFYSFKKLQLKFPAKSMKLVLFWFLMTLFLLSVIPEKKERYFLPALPPLAVLIGAMVSHHIENYQKGSSDKATRLFMLVQGILTILVIAATTIVAWQFGVKTERMDATSFLLITVSGFGLVIAAGMSLWRKKELVYSASIAAVLFFDVAIWPLIPTIKQDNPKYSDLREVRHIQAIRSKPIYSTVKLNPVRIWEIGRKVNVAPYGQNFRNNTVIVTGKPLNDAKEVFEFYPNPGNEQEVLYFNLIQ
ncbi:glycosyltransferase family 39 protein [Fulvivirga sp. 29W222]|uniref:Glycosyltransferase family 39 protein n=1 Tax=Fulvivirga marina TaxID=2494733 RepID=A0A937G0A6_9BACT|nr:glycosyltransferase family 39 protein [Fulvivirga marina]MBL6447743.1 glycosyltransferase family 39 protein [Fulvivirga marina]